LGSAHDAEAERDILRSHHSNHPTRFAVTLASKAKNVRTDSDLLPHGWFLSSHK